MSPVEERPAAAEPPPGRTAVVYGGAVIGALLVVLAGATLVSLPAGIVGGALFLVAALAQARRIIRGARRPYPPIRKA